MRIRANCWSLPALLVLMIGIGGCSGDDNNGTPPQTSKPVVSPTPAPSSSPTATATATAAPTPTPSATATPMAASGALFVADSNNNRVHAFFPPFTNPDAQLALGAPDTSSVGAGGATQSTLFGPSGVGFDKSGNLFVADTRNNRVMHFSSPISTGMNADLVLGQTTFTGKTSSLTQSGLGLPGAVVGDTAGNVFVCDSSHDRILEFEPPFSSGMNASVVLGQPDFTTDDTPTDAAHLVVPESVTVDVLGGVWVADDDNSRVVEFLPPFTNGENASIVLGQPDFTTANGTTTQNGMRDPTGVASDGSGDIFVADSGNNRVLEFKPPFTNGMNASVVIGQADFVSSTPGISQSSLSNPAAVAVDGNGNLWVSDRGSNRVLEFAPPFTNGMLASQVIGQASFTTSGAGSGADGFSNPIGINFAP